MAALDNRPGWEVRVVRRAAVRLGLAIGALGFFFGWFAPAVDRAYIHSVRTPVTVVLSDDCGDVDLGFLTCDADWTVDGEEHYGWVLRKHSGRTGEVLDAAIVDDEFVYLDVGVSVTDGVALGVGLALPVLVPLALLARRRSAARRGEQRPARTVALAPPITLGAVTAAAGAVLLAVSLDYRDPVQTRHGGAALAVGCALLLAGIPVWWPMWRRAQTVRAARRAAHAEAVAAARAAAARRSRGIPATVAPPTWWVDPATVSPGVADALALAATELPPGERLTTGRLLSAVARTDPSGDWQRIWLLTGDPNPGDPNPGGLATTPDGAGTDVEPTGPPAGGADPRTWAGVPLSRPLIHALWLAGRIGRSYRLWPVPPGVLALGLLGHRRNGATEALLAGGGTTHARLLRAVQTDILRTTLADLGALIPAANHAD